MNTGLRMTQMLDKTDKERTKRRNKMMKVVIKMFFVMGLTWIGNMISWALEAKLTKLEIFKNKGLLYSALVFDVINSCQGIIMFFMVFFDNARIKMLREKLCVCTPGGSTCRLPILRIVRRCVRPPGRRLGGSLWGAGRVGGLVLVWFLVAY